MDKPIIETYTRKSVMMSLNGCLYHKDHDFIEVTEWSNGEGWDITVSDKNFSLHFTEYEVLKKLIKKLSN